MGQDFIERWVEAGHDRDQLESVKAQIETAVNTQQKNRRKAKEILTEKSGISVGRQNTGEVLRDEEQEKSVTDVLETILDISLFSI